MFGRGAATFRNTLAARINSGAEERSAPPLRWRRSLHERRYLNCKAWEERLEIAIKFSLMKKEETEHCWVVRWRFAGKTGANSRNGFFTTPTMFRRVSKDLPRFLDRKQSFLLPERSFVRNIRENLG